MQSNFIPLPYRRVSYQGVDFDLNLVAIESYLKAKDAYFATDYIIFSARQKYCVVKVTKEERNKEELFCKLKSVEIFSMPAECVFVKDDQVDTGNLAALAKKAKEFGAKSNQTLIVEGAFGHINFIARPQPLILEVVDQTPPKSRLLDLVEKALAYKNIGPIVISPKLIDVTSLTKGHSADSFIFPCAGSGISLDRPVFFLDQHPEKSPWVLVGCERTNEIYNHFYGEIPQRIESCPRELNKTSANFQIVRCCRWQTSYSVNGKIAYVPWGAELELVIQALQELFKNT